MRTQTEAQAGRTKQQQNQLSQHRQQKATDSKSIKLDRTLASASLRSISTAASLAARSAARLALAASQPTFCFDTLNLRWARSARRSDARAATASSLQHSHTSAREEQQQQRRQQ